MIKKATISGEIPLDPEKKISLLLLDGYNNPGFSGGPIVYRDLTSATSSPSFDVVGVVHGFRPELVPTMKMHDIPSPEAASDVAKSQPWRIAQKTNGTWFEYVDTGDFVSLNTGIVQAFGIQPAIDLIKQHPIGPDAKDLPNNTPTVGSSSNQ